MEAPLSVASDMFVSTEDHCRYNLGQVNHHQLQFVSLSAASDSFVKYGRSLDLEYTPLAGN
jgi:hypothetical protein